MPRPDLRAAGEALYGEHWVSPLARDLAVNRRTIQRWSAGDGAPDDGKMAALRALLRRRLAAITALLR